jgi:hypothetical protein
MSSEVKLVLRATALGVSAFTSGYFARMTDDGKGNMATVGFIFALCVAAFVVIMMIFDAE